VRHSALDDAELVALLYATLVDTLHNNASELPPRQLDIAKKRRIE
jgi:hypothetical protein